MRDFDRRFPLLKTKLGAERELQRDRPLGQISLGLPQNPSKSSGNPLVLDVLWINNCHSLTLASFLFSPIVFSPEHPPGRFVVKIAGS